MLKSTLVEAGLSRAKFSTYRPAILFALAGLLGLVCAFQAKAQTGVDPQIYVCTGCTSSPGGEPNVINPGSINVGFDGNHTALSPLSIIVAVPNASADPTISLPSGVIPIGAGTYYTLATNGGLTGELDGTLTSGQDVYSALSLTNAKINLTVPEPKSMLLFGTGLLVLGGILRRRRSLRT